MTRRSEQHAPIPARPVLRIVALPAPETPPPRSRLRLRLLLAGLATAALGGALATLVFAAGPDVLLRWWHRAPSLTLASLDHTATPLEPDPAAWRLEAARPDDLLSVDAVVGTDDVRALAWDAPRRRLLAATTGGLLVLDAARVRVAEGCAEIPRDAIRRIGTRDGLPTHRIDDVLALGDVGWLATDAGLVRLDLAAAGGPRVVANRTEGLSSPRLSALALLGGDLWVGAHDGGLHRLHGDVLEAVGLGDRRLDEITALLADEAQGALLVGTTAGVVRLAGGRPQRVGRAWITSLAASHGRVVAAGPDGVFEVRGSRLVRSRAIGHLAAGAALAASGGLLVAGLDGGVVGRDGRPLRATFDGPVRALLQADGLTFWATAAGLHVGDPAGHLHPVHLGGLPSNDLTAVAVVSGHVIVGTFDDGLALVGGGRVRPLAAAVTPEVNHLAPAGDDAVWASTADGLWRVSLDGTAVRFGTAEGLADDHVTAAAPARDGSVWVATGGGLTRLSPDPSRRDGYTAHTWRTGQGLPSDNLYAVAAMDDGGAVAGTLHGLVRVHPDGRLEVVGPGDGRLPDGWVQALLPGPGAPIDLAAGRPSSTLWIGTYDAGLVRDDAGRFTRLAEGIGRPWGRVNPGALALHAGRILVGTQGGGLVALRGQRVRRYTVAEGLPSDDVKAMASDGDVLWVATRGGLARLRFAPDGALAMEVR